MSLEVFCEVGVTHVSGSGEFGVERKGSCERVGSLAAFTQLQIVEQQRTVERVSAIVDDSLSALNGVFTTEVGDTLVGDYDVNRVLAVVGMSNHRNDVADEATFGD